MGLGAQGGLLMEEAINLFLEAINELRLNVLELIIIALGAEYFKNFLFLVLPNLLKSLAHQFFQFGVVLDQQVLSHLYDCNLRVDTGQLGSIELQVRTFFGDWQLPRFSRARLEHFAREPELVLEAGKVLHRKLNFESVFLPFEFSEANILQKLLLALLHQFKGTDILKNERVNLVKSFDLREKLLFYLLIAGDLNFVLFLPHHQDLLVLVVSLPLIYELQLLFVKLEDIALFAILVVKKAGEVFKKHSKEPVRLPLRLHVLQMKNLLLKNVVVV